MLVIDIDFVSFMLTANNTDLFVRLDLFVCRILTL